MKACNGHLRLALLLLVVFGAADCGSGETEEPSREERVLPESTIELDEPVAKFPTMASSEETPSPQAAPEALSPEVTLETSPMQVAQGTPSSKDALEVSSTGDKICENQDPTALDKKIQEWTRAYHDVMSPLAKSLLEIHRRGVSSKTCNRLVATTRNATDLITEAPDPEIGKATIKSIELLRGSAESYVSVQRFGSNWRYLEGIDLICYVHTLLTERYFCSGLNEILPLVADIKESCGTLPERMDALEERLRVAYRKANPQSGLEGEECEVLLGDAKDFIDSHVLQEMGMSSAFWYRMSHAVERSNCRFVKDYSYEKTMTQFDEFRRVIHEKCRLMSNCDRIGA